MEIVTLVVGVIAVVLAVAVVFLIQRGTRGSSGLKAEIEADRAQLADMADNIARAQGEMAGRLAQIAESNTTGQAAISKTLEERLDAVGKRLGDGLEQSSAKTAESLGDLKKHLNVIDQAQAKITGLTEQVVNLQDLLANKQARGAFGEIQLEDLVSNILPPSIFDFQVTLSNGKRADCLIRLPEPPGPIVVDAKFPLESYEALRAAKDDQARVQASRSFTTDLQKHIVDISEKYILPGETADSALMFLPSEAIYAELHANFRNVVDRAHRAKVWIVSPTTLWALLNTVRAVLKDARMHEQAGVIQKEVHTLLGDVQRLDDRVAKLQQHFALADKDMRDIRISTDKISKRGQQIEDVELEDESVIEDLAPNVTRLTGDS